MIPRRITLEGFLCYRDRQDIDLDGCDLWVLSGRNGSGKSAVFDAMTFALFKTHRGGKQNFENLIHTEASALSVSFEFDLGAERFRVKRSYRRNGGSDRGVFRRKIESDGVESWRPVPETDNDKGLEQWVKHHIGLTYASFTASVLLLQGQSESLIGAKPAERYKIVSGIVDMDRYARLHDRADEHRKERKAAAAAHRERLHGMPEVEPAAIEQADRRAAEAQAARQTADDAWKRLVERESQARQWAGLLERRQDLSGRVAECRALLDDAETIQRDAARLRELEAALPLVRQALDRRAEIERLTEQSARDQAQRAAIARRLDLIEQAAADNRSTLEAIAAKIADDDQRDRAILAQQAALAEPIQRARLAAAAAERIRGLEAALDGHPADLPQRVEALEADQRRCAEWAAALPSLEALSRERDRLAEASQRLPATREAIERVRSAAQRAEARLAECRQAETLARAAEAQARDRLTEAETLARALDRRIEAFDGLRGSAVCDRCGQELTPAHRAAETARLQTERDQAARAVQQTGEAARSARESLAAAESARAEADRTLAAERQSLVSAERDAAQAEGDARDRAAACLAAFDALDDAFRDRVAAGSVPDDWLATTFPTAADLEEGRRLRAGRKDVEAALNDARTRLQKIEADRAKLDQERRSLAALGLQPDDAQAQARHDALQADRQTLATRLSAHATERKLAEANRARLDQIAAAHRRRDQDAARNLDAGTARRETLQSESARALEAAPEGWRAAIPKATAAELDAWDRERAALVGGGAADRAAALTHARSRLEEAEAELRKVDADRAAIPEDARCAVATIAAELEAADSRRKTAEAEHRARQSEADSLRATRDQRAMLTTKALEAERDLAVAETLAEYLGWRGLQRSLIRDAERGIVDCANPILHEFSNGELQLRLLESHENERDTALMLEVIERVQGRTGTRAVEYLSGSQKFRVAVGLALGIGQYARGGDGRPIESVIIDEGFGCLDRQGRDEMIEELNALKGRLARIVLVSHQEEFAQAFRDGYHFEVQQGSTVARPFHR